MPPHTRSQRRRQGARQQQRQQRPVNQPVKTRDVSDVADETPAPETTQAAIYDDVALPRAPTMTAAANPPRAAATRTTRRMRARAEPEPVDYSKDYQAARRDLRWIAIWAVLLFVVMVVLRISGIV